MQRTEQHPNPKESVACCHKAEATSRGFGWLESRQDPQKYRQQDELDLCRDSTWTPQCPDGDKNQQKVPEAERGLANVRELGSDRRERSPGQVLRGTLTHQRNLASTLKETLKFIN